MYATFKRQLSRLFPNIPCSAPVPDQPPTLKCKSLPPSPDPVSETLHTPSLSMLAYSEGAVAAFEVEGAGVELEAGDAAAAAAAPALASAAAAVVISRKGHSTISSCKHLLARGEEKSGGHGSYSQLRELRPLQAQALRSRVSSVSGGGQDPKIVRPSPRPGIHLQHEVCCRLPGAPSEHLCPPPLCADLHKQHPVDSSAA